MFVIQRVLEAQGRMTLLDQNRCSGRIRAFRLFATANTVGLGDTSGLYHGTQQINQGQMDRWSIVTQLNYLAHGDECKIILAKCPGYDTAAGRKQISSMVMLADLTRNGFMAGDISTVMSPRTVITWAENAEIFGDLGFAFRLTFLNKCDEAEREHRGRVLSALLRGGTPRVGRQSRLRLSWRQQALSGAEPSRASTSCSGRWPAPCARSRAAGRSRWRSVAVSAGGSGFNSAPAVRLALPRADLIQHELAGCAARPIGRRCASATTTPALHRRFAPERRGRGMLYDSARGAQGRNGRLASGWPACAPTSRSAYRARCRPGRPGERGQDATMAEIVDLYARERLLGFGCRRRSRSRWRPGANGWTSASLRSCRRWRRRRRSGRIRTAGARAAGPSRALRGAGRAAGTRVSPTRTTTTASSRRPAATRMPMARVRARSSSRARRSPRPTAAATRSPRPRRAPARPPSRPRARMAARTIRRRIRAATGRNSCPRAATPWPTRSTPPSSTRWSRSRSCAAPASWAGCVPSSTSRWSASRA